MLCFVFNLRPKRLGLVVDKKIVISLVAVLVVGLVAGFALNYVVNRPGSGLSPTPNPTSTPGSTSTPSPINTPSPTATQIVTRDDLQVTNASADKNGNYFDIYFNVQNIGKYNATLNLIYIGQTSNMQFPGVTSILINGISYTPGAFTRSANEPRRYRELHGDAQQQQRHVSLRDAFCSWRSDSFRVHISIPFLDSLALVLRNLTNSSEVQGVAYSNIFQINSFSLRN